MTVKLLQYSLKTGLSSPRTNGMDVFIECFQDLPIQLPPQSLDDKNNHCKYLNTHCGGLAVDCMRKKWWYAVMALNMLALSHREAAPVRLLQLYKVGIGDVLRLLVQVWKARTSCGILPSPACSKMSVTPQHLLRVSRLF